MAEVHRVRVQLSSTGRGPKTRYFCTSRGGGNKAVGGRSCTGGGGRRNGMRKDPMGRLACRS
eukprot:7182260-Pyramimonas_sp.AAC.1